MKVFKKTLIWLLIVVGVILMTVVLTVLSVIIFEPVIYGDFYKDAKSEFGLPGISDGFVQQGIAHSGDYFFSSGYMSGDQPSRIYITDGEGKSTWVSLKDNDGMYFKGHAGGIAVHNDTVFVCGDESGQMLVYSRDDILNAESSGSVTATDDFTVHSNTSFCYVLGDTLYVGEFYREQGYSTDASHHMTTPAGDKNHALIFAYGIDAATSEVSAMPNTTYSAPDLAQGMCITKSGRIVISTSYGFASSHLYVYEPPATTTHEFTVDGTAVPLYYLDNSTLKQDIVSPPMAECLAYVDGRVYVIGESASNKYIFGKILRARDVWSLPIS